MRRYNDFSRENTIRDRERLPIGGYVVRILEAKEIETEYGNRLLISFDIAEGEYKDFFKKDYQSQAGEDKRWKGNIRFTVPSDDGTEKDGWAKRRFNTLIVDLEKSNQGYVWNWDEQTMKNKLIGALFNNKEYEIDGKKGFFTNCKYLVDVEKIRSGNYKIPADDLLQQNTYSPTYNTKYPKDNRFMQIPDNVEDDGLPFN